MFIIYVNKMIVLKKCKNILKMNIRCITKSKFNYYTSFYVVAFSSELKKIIKLQLCINDVIKLNPKRFIKNLVYKQKCLITKLRFSHSLEIVVVIFKAVEISANKSVFKFFLILFVFLISV